MPSTLILVGSLWRRSRSSFLVNLRIGLSRVEEAAASEDAAVPAVHAVTRDRERALVERLAVVVQLRQVEVGDGAPALAARTHAAVVDGLPDNDPLPRPCRRSSPRSPCVSGR